MEARDVAVFVLAVPAACASLAAFLLRGTGRDAALALALAFAAACLGLIGVPAGVPKSATGWFLPLAVAAGLAAWIADRPGAKDGTGRAGEWTERIVATALAVLTAAACAPRAGPFWWIVVGSVALVALRRAWLAAFAATGPAPALATVALVGAASAPVLFLSGWASIALICAALGAAAGARLLLARWRPAPVEGVATVASALLGAAWIQGLWQVEAPVASVALLAVAPVALLIPGGAGRTATVVRLACVTVAGAAAVLVTRLANPASDY